MTTLKTKASEERSPIDVAKHLLAALLLAAGIIGFYWYEDVSQALRLLGLVAAVVVSAVLFLTTRIGRGVMDFAREARIELRKVIWPTRQETFQTTLVVLIVVLIVAIFLWLLDMLLGFGVRSLAGIGV